jgi:GDSL-like lipase/acylhydrolase family protein
VTGRYVALGSSMAAGPGIRPRAPGAPFGSGRSARNYAHLVAEQLNLDLADVTFSGATTAHVLAESQRGAPPQMSALDGSESLVTITIGGNDVGYVPLLMVAALLGSIARRLPRGAYPPSETSDCPYRRRTRLARLLPAVAALLDREARERALGEVGDSLCAVGSAVRRKAPRARVVFVDYLTLLPPVGMSAAPLSADDADLGRHVGACLEKLTAAAAQATGCELVRAGQASRDHHCWSTDPWAFGTGWPLPWRPAPFHPNVAGMRAFADLIVGPTGVN